MGEILQDAARGGKEIAKTITGKIVEFMKSSLVLLFGVFAVWLKVDKLPKIIRKLIKRIAEPIKKAILKALCKIAGPLKKLWKRFFPSGGGGGTTCDAGDPDEEDTDDDCKANNAGGALVGGLGGDNLAGNLGGGGSNLVPANLGAVNAQAGGGGNSSCFLFPKDKFGGNFTTPGGPVYKTNPASGDRAEESIARVCWKGGGTDAYGDPPGWKKIWNKDLPRGKAKVARCHLLGKQFGGTGNKKNTVPCCQSENLKMAVEENQAAKFVDKNACIDIRVKAYYSGPKARIPRRITFLAKGPKCSGGCKTFRKPVHNPKALTECPVK